MSAREDILARVRSAVADAARIDRPPATGERRAASVELFVQRVADYGAVIERCAASEVARRVAATVQGQSVVVADGVAVAVQGAQTESGLTALDLERIDTAVTGCFLAIAETGTLVLDHGPGQGRRLTTLVPDRHVCIVLADQVVADVPAAVALLDPRRPQTWISGPSATSDIELQRVEGVHGPRSLHVVVVD